MRILVRPYTYIFILLYTINLLAFLFKSYDTQVSLAVTAIIVTMHLAFIGLSNQLRLNARWQAVTEFNRYGMNPLGEALADVSILAHPIIVQLPNHRLTDEIFEYHEKAWSAYSSLLNGSLKLRQTLETYEIALLKFEKEIRLILVEVEYLKTELQDEIPTLLSLVNSVQSHEDLKIKIQHIFEPLRDRAIDIQMYMLDLRKYQQNFYFKNIFLTVVSKRNPIDKKYKTLEEVLKARDPFKEWAAIEMEALRSHT